MPPFGFCFPLQFSSNSSLDCFFLHIQPPHEAYWSFQCTNYPAWPWMSLWTAVCLWSTCLDSLHHRWKKGEKQITDWHVEFWVLLFVKQVWHPLKWPVCLSAVTSCAIEWALDLADQHLHMHPCICDYSECMCVWVCMCACACGQNYRSVHPALPPSVLRQATGHFIHSHPLHTAT